MWLCLSSFLLCSSWPLLLGCIPWSDRITGSKAILKVALKPIIEALKHEGNQLEHHARKLRNISPNLEAEAEALDDRVGPSESRSRFWNNGNSHESEGTVDSPFHHELQGSAAQ